MLFKKFNLLDMKLTKFNILIIIFEIAVLFFMIYQITILDVINKDLTKAHSDKFKMIQVSDKLRQSSDDLTHFARSYAVTENLEFEKRYLNTLKIRNGKKARPLGYNGIYWDLDKDIREKKHPNGQKQSLRSIVEDLPFSKEELQLLKISEDNANDLVEIEVEAFSSMKMNNYKRAVQLLHSKDYYKAKHKIMLPLDNMMTILEKRTQDKIVLLDKKVRNKFTYIFIVGFFFILVNFFIYLLIHKKITVPIKYLTSAINKFENNIDEVEKKHFYKDEVGYMIEQFFHMQDSISEQKNKLKHLNENLKTLVAEQTADIKKQNKKLESLIIAFDKNVIASKTDLKGKITYASEAFCNVSGYSQEELIGQAHNIVRHPDVPKKAFKDMWDTIQSKKTWTGEVKNLKKDGGFYWVNAVISPDYDENEIHIGYSAVRHNITVNKELEELSLNLEKKVQMQTKDILYQKEFMQTLLDSQEQLILTTDGAKLLSANKTFLNFFAIDSIDLFKDEYEIDCICDLFKKDAPDDYLQKMMGDQEWIDYVISSPSNTMHKVIIPNNGNDFIFSLSATKLPGNKGRKSAVFTNITEMELAKLEIEHIHKQTKSSIEYAALIQNSLIPDTKNVKNYFKDYFAIWHPKDLVGGDIYFFEELRDKDECLLMVIDCTGHGVPGAFVTMLVKAIERSIVLRIKNSDEIVSPAKLLSVFNSSMKHILKQDDNNSISNAGFDGQIMYFNKKEHYIKVASARNEIFYYQDSQLHILKGDRQSIGYKDSDINYKFTEHTIDTKKETTIYLFTDGYWDQIGGEKQLPFGKKRLKNLLNNIYTQSMADQQEDFLYTMKNYRDGYEINDDTTIIGMKI